MPKSKRLWENRAKQEPRYYLLVLLIVLATLGVVVYLVHPDLKQVSTDCNPNNLAASEYNVKLSDASTSTYNIELLKTPLQHELGLSDRPCIPKNAALLFLFALDDKYGIWMKNMHFPIDVIWLDKDKKVVTIEKNMLPDSYPKIYYPSKDVRYVLEFNTGAIDSLQAHEGSQFSW